MKKRDGDKNPFEKKNLVKLAGAEFKLEKLTADGISDSAFAAQTVITGKEN